MVKCCGCGRIDAGDVRPLVPVATWAAESQIAHGCLAAVLPSDDGIDLEARTIEPLGDPAGFARLLGDETQPANARSAVSVLDFFRVASLAGVDEVLELGDGAVRNGVPRHHHLDVEHQLHRDGATEDANKLGVGAALELAFAFEHPRRDAVEDSLDGDGGLEDVDAAAGLLNEIVMLALRIDGLALEEAAAALDRLVAQGLVRDYDTGLQTLYRLTRSKGKSTRLGAA